MNLVLLADHELDPKGQARVGGRRSLHIRRILKKSVGDTVRVGVVGGLRGHGVVADIDDRDVVLQVVCEEASPPKRPLTVVLALPRPPVLRRIVQQVTAMGVARLVLIHSCRVEKSYWQSPSAERSALIEEAQLGLEQSVDTILPEIRCCRSFARFVDEDVAALIAGSSAFVAEPAALRPCPVDVAGLVTLAIGPEGGFIPFEVERLCRAGFVPMGLGPRILRVETAVVASLARLSLGCATD